MYRRWVFYAGINSVTYHLTISNTQRKITYQLSQKHRECYACGVFSAKTINDSYENTTKLCELHLFINQKKIILSQRLNYMTTSSEIISSLPSDTAVVCVQRGRIECKSAIDRVQSCIQLWMPARSHKQSVSQRNTDLLYSHVLLLKPSVVQRGYRRVETTFTRKSSGLLVIYVGMCFGWCSSLHWFLIMTQGAGLLAPV